MSTKDEVQESELLKRLRLGEDCYNEGTVEDRSRNDVILCALRFARVDRIKDLITKYIPISKFVSGDFCMEMLTAIFQNIDEYRLKGNSSLKTTLYTKYLISVSVKNIERNHKVSKKIVESLPKTQHDIEKNKTPIIKK